VGLTQHKLAVVPFPTGIGSTALAGPQYRQFINASMQIFVNAETKYPKQAIDFLNAVANDPEFAKVQLMSRGVPMSAKIADLLMPDISPVEQSMVGMIRFVQTHSTSLFVPWSKAGSQIQDLMQRSHQEIAFGHANVAQTVAKFLDEAGQIIG
jgi:multiple sugar transport system substrate-binding protein